MSDTGIGASVRRKEDLRFVQGAGKYTDDMNLVGQVHAYILRSPHAHAAVRSIDTSAARANGGVVAVFTSEDMAEVGGIPCGWQVHSKDGSAMAEPKHPVLAEGKVRHVGDPVAVVLAESRTQARDAAESIIVDYDVLDAVVDMQAAVTDGATSVHDDVGTNVCYDWGLGDNLSLIHI